MDVKKYDYEKLIVELLALLNDPEYTKAVYDLILSHYIKTKQSPG